MIDHDLAARVLRFADDRSAAETPIETGVDGLTVMRARTPTMHEPLLYGPLLCLVLQGRKETYLGSERVSFGAGEAVVVSLEIPTRARVVEASRERPYLALALRIDLELVREIVTEAGAAELAEERARAIASGEADAALVAAMGRLLDLADRPLEQRMLLPLHRREVHFRILLATTGGMLRRLARPDSHASRIARTLARLGREFAHPLRITDLADAAGMSPSSFHAHFKAITATTPLQYLKDLRLLEARRQLVAGSGSVSRVAFAVGYESPTQFSREYSRKFGVPPRADRAA